MPAEGAELKSSLSLAFGISPVVETFFEKKTKWHRARRYWPRYPQFPGVTLVGLHFSKGFFSFPFKYLKSQGFESEIDGLCLGGKMGRPGQEKGVYGKKMVLKLFIIQVL